MFLFLPLEIEMEVIFEYVHHFVVNLRAPLSLLHHDRSMLCNEPLRSISLSSCLDIGPLSSCRSVFISKSVNAQPIPILNPNPNANANALLMIIEFGLFEC